MPEVVRALANFALAGLAEVGGGWLVWQWLRESRPWPLGVVGALVLISYGVIATFHTDPHFGRVYAAYGGIFIAMALTWGYIVDGFRPDRWDLIGRRRLPRRGADYLLRPTRSSNMNVNADTRLYSATIAGVSGIYSIVSTLGDSMGSMPMSDSIMLIVGVVVLVHGLVLLTPAAARLGRASGPLMILWAAIMLGNQALAAVSNGSVMGTTSWDGGMVAMATLMLASGLIMSRWEGM